MKFEQYVKIFAKEVYVSLRMVHAAIVVVVVVIFL